MAEEQRGVIGRTVHFVLRAIRNYFIFIGVLVTVLPVALTYAIAHRAQRDDGGSSLKLSKQHPTRLKLDLGGKIAEHEPGFTEVLMARLFKTERELYLPDLRTTMKRAGKDERVKSLTVILGPLAGSAADYTELRRILAEFREAGKPVDVYVTDAENWGYYVATAGNHITLNPASPVTVTGPVFQLIYFGDALKKLGVDIDVVRAGKYKSAFEPFVANAPSEPTLEEYNSMQASLLGHITELVAKGRGKPVDTVTAWYKKSIFTAADAVKNGLVDSLGYPGDGKDAAKDGAKDKADDAEGDDSATVAEYDAATRHDKDNSAESVKGKGGIGLIEAVGEINLTEQSSANPAKSDEGITPRAITKQIRWALEDDDVKAVVLRVSSPGGSAIASDVIWNELQTLAKVKPLVVSMGAYAASGGYYISVPARYIVAEPTTLTGSIGVIGMMPSVAAFQEKYGISFYVVSSSDRRNMMNLGGKATPEDKALVDATIDEVYQTFLRKVSEGRKLPLATVAQLAQGRVYTGLQGKELGLVDEIGGMQAAFKKAKELAGFDTAKLYPVLRYEGDELSISECLSNPSKMLRCLDQGDSHLGLMAGGIGAVLRPSGAEVAADRLGRWLTTASRERALTLWPGYLGVTLR